jgi:hypothetical protein
MKLINIPTKYQRYLIGKPETGMGYQIVDITTTNGEVYTSQVVVNSEKLIWKEPQELRTEDITNVEISKK